MLRQLTLATALFVGLLVLARGPTATPVVSMAPAVENEVLVQLRAPFWSLPDAMLSDRFAADVTQRLSSTGSLLLRLHDGETPASAVTRLARLPQVEFAEPNYRLSAAAAPNDPFYTAQSTYMNVIEAPSAWDIETGDDSVLVAVLDSGLDLDHPDLQGKYWTNVRELDDNNLDDDGNGCVDDRHGCSFISKSSSDPSCAMPRPGLARDHNGHGTFVAGIIAAKGNNGIGLSGGAPGVTILPVKILDCTGGGTASEAAQAILYAAKVGARVANISFSADGESMTLANALREAQERYGMVIVAPTGNDGKRGVTFPARLPQIIAVASSGTPGDANARSPFSDWGPEVAVAAPGLNIVSTVPKAFCDSGAWPCVPNQPYAISSGTSYAAPLVSALAALLISRTPNLPPAAVRQIILPTADPLPDGSTPNWDGAGRIRMRAALNQTRYSLGVPGVTHQ